MSLIQKKKIPLDKNIPDYYKDNPTDVTPGKSEPFSFFYKWGERKRLKKLASFANGKVLDIGYAYGVNPFLKDAWGIDVFIPEKKPSNYSNFFTLDIDKPYPYPFLDNYFDCIIAGEVIEHIPNLDGFMKEIHRILKPNGIFAISTPNPESPIEVFIHFQQWLKGYNFGEGGKGDHVHEFPTTNMISLANSYNFKVFKIQGTYFQIPFTNIQISTNIVPLAYQTIFFLKKI